MHVDVSSNPAVINMTLSEQIQNEDVKAAIVTDCVLLMDEQVSDKGGLGGIALKTAYGVIKSFDPYYIPGAIERLLPEALAAIEPIWVEGVESGDPVKFLTDNCSRTADLLLSTTDAKIQRGAGSVVRSTYNKLRNSVKGDVESAVPGLAKILGTHVKG